MESYTTILQRASFEYEDRKSIFIGDAMPVSEEKDALAFIAAIKKKYPDASHHVYAYVLRDNSIMRFSDDREPQGTAGMPVLDSIRKNNCTDTVVVVTRYFGGTLLGTGGLVRAYTAAAAGALNAAGVITYDTYSDYEITLSYSDFQKLQAKLAELSFRSKDIKYTDNVLIVGNIIKEKSENFEKKIQEIVGGRAKIDFLGEKFDF